MYCLILSLNIIFLKFMRGLKEGVLEKKISHFSLSVFKNITTKMSNITRATKKENDFCGS